MRDKAGGNAGFFVEARRFNTASWQRRTSAQTAPWLISRFVR